MSIKHLFRMSLVLFGLPFSLHAQPWVQVYPGFNSNDVLDFQRWHGDTVFACGTNGNFIITADGGRTWSNAIPQTLDWDFIRVESDGRNLYLLPSPNRASQYLLKDYDSTRYLLFRYNVYTRTIERIDIPTPTKARVMDMSITPDCITLYQSVKDSALLVQSTDEGKTWTYTLIPKEIQMYGTRYPTIHFRDKNRGILISFPNVTNGYAYLTLNGGLTWKRIEDVTYPFGFYFDCSPKHPGHWLNDSVAVLISEGNIPYLTTNGGSTWTRKPILPSGIGSIEMASENIGVAVGRNFEIYRTLDAWESAVSLFPSLHTQLNRPLVCAVDTMKWIVGGLHGLKIYTTDGGMTWGDEYLTDVYITQLHFFNRNEGACTLTDIYTGERWYCRTTDAGRTWVRRSLLRDFYLIYHTTSEVAYGVGGQPKTTTVYKTEDAGQTWTMKYQSAITDSIDVIQPFTRATDPDFFICNTYNLKYLRTTDGGDTWIVLNGPTFDAADWTFRGNSWVLSHMNQFQNDIYKTEDDGETWKMIEIQDTITAKRWYTNIYALSQKDVVVDPTIFFNNYIKVFYRSNDGGETWTKVEPPDLITISKIFPSGVIYGWGRGNDSTVLGFWNRIGYSYLQRFTDLSSLGIEVFRYSYSRQALTGEWFILDENTIWIAMYNTIFHTTNGGISWTELPLPGTRSVSLQQNYPNPVAGSGSTTIPFTVTGNREVHVRIEVHDLLGRKVATVHDKPVSPGSHSALWVTRGVAPGMYLVRNVGAESEVRKVVVR